MSFTRSALVLLTFLAPLPAQEVADAAPARPTPKLALEPGEHDLVDLIERASGLLGRNFVFEPSDFQHARRSVILQQPLSLDREGCEVVLGQLLYSKGFAIVPIDAERSLFEIISMQGPRRAELQARAVTMTAEQVTADRAKKIVVRCNLRLEHTDAPQITTRLRPLFAAPGAAHGLTFGGLSPRVIVLQGFADQVATAIETIRGLDQPRAAPSARERDLEARIAQLEETVAKLTRKVEALEQRQ